MKADEITVAGYMGGISTASGGACPKRQPALAGRPRAGVPRTALEMHCLKGQTMRRYETAVAAFDDIMDEFSARIEENLAEQDPDAAADYYTSMLEFEDQYGQPDDELALELVNASIQNHRALHRAADSIRDLLGIITKVRPENEETKIASAETARLDLLRLAKHYGEGIICENEDGKEKTMTENNPGKVREFKIKAGGDMAQAIYDVLAERLRQVDDEGWTADHDDAHSHGQMAGAALCYLAEDIPHWAREQAHGCYWPWDADWWKPGDHRRNLVKAGALILAEIERLDRAERARDMP